MIITSIRSSLINNYSFCQQQCFLNYVLGIPRKSGKKADKGSCVHKVLELLARIKKEFQTKQEDNIVFNDKMLDTAIAINKQDFLLPYRLTNEEVDTINKTRINKSNYKHDCHLKHGHIRYGKDLVEHLIQCTYNYFKENTPHVWQPVDFRDITNWIWMELDELNGSFDPRKRTVIEAEQFFDFIIDKPWANYKWKIKGREISGKLNIKGTIDLITEVDSDTLEVIDFKSGIRIDWATGEEKTYNKLQSDFQLMLYYYAVKLLYPQYKHILVTIFFIRDGGPTTIFFDDDVIQKTENIIQEKFKEICNNDLPEMIDINQENFKCTRICDYYTMKASNGKNTCRFIYDKVRNVGMQQVVELYSNPQHSIGQYDAPGI